MSDRKLQNLSIANAKLLFRNFTGRPDTYNTTGVKQFCTLIDENVAERLIADGWNVRWLKPKEEGDVPQPYLPVTVSYKLRAPKVVMINSKGMQSALDESELHILDWAEIAYVDLVVTPSRWTMNGREGIKGYLHSIYITIMEDEFEQKYANAPSTAADAIGGCGNCEECDGSCGCSHIK